MKIYVVSLFPEMFEPVFGASMLWKAQNKKIVQFELIDLRQFGFGNRRTVDDTPYGGGDGMLLMIEPLVAAIEHVKQLSPKVKVILPTPRGKLYKQSDAKRLAASGEDLLVVCPRYEGYDERVTAFVDEQICIGNYVLTGDEIPAMLIADSVVRLLPGVLGGKQSTAIESFQEDDATVEYPQHTRPEDFRGMKVPDVLLSGNHGEIEKWRKQNA